MPPLASSLPVDELRAPLREALSTHRRFVVRAPTGSGKSTRLPQFLLDDGTLSPGRVVVLQPRRLAARLLARRVAQEREVPLGSEVGYHVRLDRVAGPKTRLLYVTEGLLLRQMTSQPGLDGVAAIILDEFHERHLHGDVTLARALQVQRTVRPDLVIGVMSATLETEALRRFLEPSAVLEAEGRTYPVEIRYDGRDEKTPIWDRAAQAATKLANTLPEGDLLIFMAGAYEIHRTLEALAPRLPASQWECHALHGEMPAEAQDAAVTQGSRRKVIVATNVAETSLTIPGVRGVIDSGQARIPAFDPRRGLNTLLVQKISQASADQRAGRAGRTGPGQCTRLWSESDHRARRPFELPEVRRLDLAETFLTLLAGGVEDLDAFPWFEPPTPPASARAWQLLHDLGATTLGPEGSPSGGRLTEIGQRLAAFPLHPRYGRLLLAGAERYCLREAALVAALGEGRSILLPLNDRRKADQRDDRLGLGHDGESDWFSLLRAYHWLAEEEFDPRFGREWGLHAAAARQAGRLAQQFLQVAWAQGLEPGADHPSGSEAAELALRQAILTAFSDQLALRLDRATLRCALVHGRKGELRRQSVVRKAPLLVSAEIEERNARGEVVVFLGLNTAVEEAWLAELFPEDFSELARTHYDAGQKRVVVTRERKFRDLVLASQPGGDPDLAKAATLLAEEVTAGRVLLKGWDETVERWIGRVNFLAAHCADYGFGQIEAEARRLILEEICTGAVSAKEVREQPVWPALRAWLPAGLGDHVDRLAPERIELPNGRKARLRYEGEEAILSSTIQNLYDADPKLSVADGRVRVTFELLAPNQRPVQITRNLADFWTGSYPEIRKQLRGRYPKHEWR